MEKKIFTKDDIILLISALATHIEHSSLSASLDFDKVYLYTSKNDYDHHINFLSHSLDLQLRLIDMLDKFE